LLRARIFRSRATGCGFIVLNSTNFRVNINVKSMPHFFFLWNDELIDYIQLHGVTQDEFEEVVLDSIEVQTSCSSGRPIVFGETSTGKYLACIFEYIDRDTVLPVTAYEVD